MAVSGETMNKGGRKGSPVHKAKKRGKEEEKTRVKEEWR